MATQDYTWDLDPTGTNPANLIPGEIQNLSPANGPDFHFFIPDAAPYHENSMRITHLGTGRQLTKDVDWEPGWPFEAATNSYQQLPIWGCVVIKDRSLSGAFRIEYQTLGGEFTFDETYLLKMLQNATVDPRTTSWDVVTKRPVVYDPNDHLHHTTETGSYEALVSSVDALRAAMSAATSSAMDLFRQHVNDVNNPHRVNLEQLGIARFGDVFRATLSQVLLGQDNINYVTSELLAKAIDDSLANYNPRLPDFNPSLVGLGNLPNWPIAVREDLDEAKSERIVDPYQVYYIITKVLQDLPLGQLQAMIDSLNTHINNYENPHDVTLAQLGIGKAINMVGTAGQIAYFNGGNGPFSMTADGLVNRLAIVHTAAELTAQLNTTESFAAVFNTWTRLAVKENNLVHLPSELSGWSYDAAQDRVLSTINSDTSICLVNPEKTAGDYIFETEVSSTNTDDDYIGLVLGIEEIDGKQRMLAVYRDAIVPSNGGGRLKLIYDCRGDRHTVLAQSDALPSFNAGWAAYAQMGIVKLKAVRQGSVITVSTSNPGEDYSVVLSVDLATHAIADLIKFMGPVNLGYSAWSQAAATWKTLKRSGAKPVIAAMHNGQVWEDNGTAYVQTAKTLRDVIKAGRLYRNPTTKRIYHCGADGNPTWMTGTAAYHDTATKSAVRNGVVFNDDDNTSHMGTRIRFWNQDRNTNVMTSMGSHVRHTSTVSGDVSDGTDTPKSFLLGNETGLKGGLKTSGVGQVGFVNGADEWLAYFDPVTKVLQHYGMNRLSDSRVKVSQSDFHYDWDAVKQLELISWVWADDERVPAHMRGTVDSGVLAQTVQKAFPSCVSVDGATGLLTVDDGKLSVHLSLALLKRLKDLEDK